MPQAAERLAVSPRTVRRYVDQGELPARNAAPEGSARRLLRLRVEDVEDFATRGYEPASTYKPKHLKG